MEDRADLAAPGNDADHFTRIPAAPAPTLTIHHDAAHPSRLIMPVMPVMPVTP